MPEVTSWRAAASGSVAISLPDDSLFMAQTRNALMARCITQRSICMMALART